MATAVLLLVTPAVSQQSGQWSWEAEVGVGQRDYDTSRGGATVSEFDQTDLGLSLALNGFVVHPAILAFRVGIDLLATKSDEGGVVDTDRVGGGAEIRLLPQGAYPLRLFYTRQSYDYASTGDDLMLYGSPDTSERAGARFRVRRGVFKGTVLGVERTTIDFLNPATDEESRDLQFLDWSRGNGRFRNHVKVERKVRDYGTTDLEIEDFVVNIDERADLGRDWRWEMSGAAISRDFTRELSADLGTENYQLRNRFRHGMRESDLLDLFVTLGRFETDDQPADDSYGLSAFYRWHPRPGWEIAPFVQYGEQTSGDRTISAPRGGISTTWSRQRSALDALVSARVSVSAIERDEAGVTEDETLTAYGITGSVGHGGAPGLRKELEIELARNELRLTRDPILDLPDLGLSGAMLDSEDYYRARAGLTYRADSRSIAGWGEWSLRESTGDLSSSDFETETLSGNFHVGWRRLSVRAYLGETNARRQAEDQEVRFAGASARWRWRYLGLLASYRLDEREVALAPDIDGHRAEAGLEASFGQLRFEVLYFQNEDRLINDETQTNQGVRWAISTRFGGWLPWVTGTERRGVIR